MKNLLFTLVLLFSLHSFAQDDSYSNPVSDTFFIMATDVQGSDNALVVPDGKFWIVVANNGNFVFAEHNYFNEYATHMYAVSVTSGILPPETLIWHTTTSVGPEYFLIVTEHNFITDTSLSSTNVELPNQIRLFPNPTTSEVALNSDKQYDIEVYDILGNKVMELTGNTIDMEHLSSATYIVNALDTETNERLSYKVIKH